MSHASSLPAQPPLQRSQEHSPGQDHPPRQHDHRLQPPARGDRHGLPGEGGANAGYPGGKERRKGEREGESICDRRSHSLRNRSML